MVHLHSLSKKLGALKIQKECQRDVTRVDLIKVILSLLLRTILSYSRHNLVHIDWPSVMHSRNKNHLEVPNIYPAVIDRHNGPNQSENIIL